MSCSVEFIAAAARQLRQLDRPVRARLIVAIEGLADDPQPAGATKLVGEETAWRMRVGGYRVIFDVQQQGADPARRGAHGCVVPPRTLPTTCWTDLDRVE